MEEMNLGSAKPGQNNTNLQGGANDGKTEIDWSKLNNTKEGSGNAQKSEFYNLGNNTKKETGSSVGFFDLWKKIFFGGNDYEIAEKKLEKEIKELIKKEISVREQLRQVKGDKAKDALRIVQEQERSRIAKEEELRQAREKRLEKEKQRNEKIEEEKNAREKKQNELNSHAKNLLKTDSQKGGGWLSWLFEDNSKREQLAKMDDYKSQISSKEKEDTALEEEAKELLQQSDDENIFTKLFHSKEKIKNEKKPEIKHVSVGIKKPIKSEPVVDFNKQAKDLLQTKNNNESSFSSFWTKLFPVEQKSITAQMEQVKKEEPKKIEVINKVEQKITTPEPIKPKIEPIITQIEVAKIPEIKEPKEEIAKEHSLNLEAQKLIKMKEEKNKGFLFGLFGNKEDKNLSANKPTEEPKEIKKKKEAKKWVNPNIIETSLIKDEVISYIDWKRNALIIVIFSLVSCMFVAFIYWRLNTESTKMDSTISEYDVMLLKQQKNINDAQNLNNEANLFRKKINILSKLLDNHIYWTNFFEYLEANTTPETIYTDFSGDLSGIYRLTCRSTDYNSVAKLIKAFKDDPKTKDVWVTGDVRKKENTTEFVLNLIIKPELFYDKK